MTISDAGDKGGFLVATGTPEQVMAVDASLTGHYLKGVLGMQRWWWGESGGLR